MTTTARTPALREWAVIYDALLQGRQIVDLRKGGIHESDRRFALRSARFWLYPGYEHQRPGLLKPAFRPDLERVLGQAPPPSLIRLPGWAEVVATAELSDSDTLRRLDDEFIWTPDYAVERLRWKSTQPLLLLVLRAYRLADPVEVPWRDQYRGCTSWADLVDLPPDPTALPSWPALSDAQFADRYAGLQARLPSLSAGGGRA